MDDIHSLSHTKWNCKYHIVFAPKYRRKVFYGEKRLEIGKILRQLCNWKGVNIINAEVCPDHVHMLLEIPSKMSVSFGVKDGEGKPLPGIDVTLDGETSATDTNGGAMFLKNIGEYEYSVRGGLYKEVGGTVTVGPSGNKHAVVMNSAGASYDEISEILSIEPGFSAWSEAEGGKEISSGDVVERGSVDRIVYIENASGERTPFVIPALGMARIGSVKALANSDGRKLEVSVVNYSGKAANDMLLVGRLYDVSGKCEETRIFEITNLKSGEERTLMMNFERNVAGYNVRLYLWDKSTLAPQCPRRDINAVYFSVTDGAGKPLSGIEVTLDGEKAATDTNGGAVFLKDTGAYEYTVRGEMYKAVYGTLSVEPYGNKHAVIMNSVGASYDEISEILSIESGYSAWSEAEGGKEISSGDVVERGSVDRIVYIENASGERTPFVIPALGMARIDSVKVISGSDGRKLEADVVNYNRTAAGNMMLIGSLYDESGKCAESHVFEVSGLKTNEERTVIMNFERSLADYTLRLYLWDKSTFAPQCPRVELTA